MTSNRVVSIVGLALVLSLFSGCLWAPDLDRVRREIEEQMPGVSFDRQFAISLGPISLGLVRLITRLVPDAAEARSYLKDLSSVKVAVYDAENIPEDPNLKMPSKLESLVNKEGWEVAAKVRQDTETVWLIYRTQQDEIKDLYVVALSEDELVLVRAHGNIDQLVTKAMRDHVEPNALVGIPAF
jgi:hypothetical protein